MDGRLYLVAAAKQLRHSGGVAGLHRDVQRHRTLRVLGICGRIVRQQLRDDVRLPVVRRNVQRRALRLQQD